MPNTPALVGQGAAGISAGSAATADDVRLGGAASWRPSAPSRSVPEHHLDAVTGLAGSGPAYLFMVAEALIDAGVLAGLSRTDRRRRFVTAAVRRIGRDARGTRRSAALRAMVTSPGGTTAAGLEGARGARAPVGLPSAVMAATERSRELGARRPEPRDRLIRVVGEKISACDSFLAARLCLV